MYYFDLPPLGTGRGLSFEWDPVTGTISGRDADWVMMAVEDALRDGSVTSHPWPTSYPVHDPLHHLAEMAAVLSQFCLLDSQLQPAFFSRYGQRDSVSAAKYISH